MSSSVREIVLASRSPRRREILHAAGVAFTCVDPAIDEAYDNYAGRSAVETALDVAKRKAAAVASRFEDAAIIGADTIVVLDSEEGESILGIPRERRESRVMLERLSGRAHRVISGVVIRHGVDEFAEADVATVLFKRLSPAEMDKYVETGEGDDKAGAYAAQGLGRTLIDRVDGDIQTVIGFPMTLVRKGFFALSLGDLP